jgi:hypothetical protein
MRYLSAVSLLFAAILFSSSVLAAGVPSMISYQGRLNDSAGDPVDDGNYQVTFSIYDVPFWGTALWTSGTVTVTVTDGLFTHLLGSSVPLSDGLFAGSAIRYLGIKIGSDAEMTPRTRLVSMPYAHHALRADTTGYANVVADNAVTSASLADGTIQFIDLGQNGAAHDQIIKWNGTSWTSADDDAGPPSEWTVIDSVLYTDNLWGIARGGAGNKLWEAYAYSHVNFGVNCTTGVYSSSRAFCTVGGGRLNTASDFDATVAGGCYNSASSTGATVGGGGANASSGLYATIGGGYGNTGGGLYATIGGGSENTASGMAATVSGGSDNTASGDQASVGGGYYNTAQGQYATVSGGKRSIAGGLYATISGGDWNTASGSYSTVPGGYANTAGGTSSFAAGWRAMANHVGTFVWADSANSSFASTDTNQFLIRASGGVGINTNSPGVPLNVDGGTDASLASGGFVAIGAMTSRNLTLDDNEILVRNNGEPATLYVNRYSGNVLICANTSAKVGIGTTDPDEKLHVSGNICYTGTIGACSDERYKKNVATIQGALATLVKLRGVTYNWKQDEYPDQSFDDRTHVGFIAQELKELVPEIVMVSDEGYMSVDYGRLTPLLVEALKQLKGENDELKARLAKVEANLQQLIDNGQIR